MGTEKQIRFEASVGDIRHHNSKLDDNSWVDVTVRVMGEASILAAMNLHRAKSKIVKIIYEIEDD